MNKFRLEGLIYDVSLQMIREKIKWENVGVINWWYFRLEVGKLEINGCVVWEHRCCITLDAD